MSEENKITIVRCRCGDDVCNRHGLSDGIFPQGAGWEKERAQEHADAINGYDSLVAQNKALTEAADEANTCIEDLADQYDDFHLPVLEKLRSLVNHKPRKSRIKIQGNEDKASLPNESRDAPEAGVLQGEFYWRERHRENCNQ